MELLCLAPCGYLWQAPGTARREPGRRSPVTLRKDHPPKRAARGTAPRSGLPYNSSAVGGHATTRVQIRRRRFSLSDWRAAVGSHSAGEGFVIPPQQDRSFYATRLVVVVVHLGVKVADVRGCMALALVAWFLRRQNSGQATLRYCHRNTTSTDLFPLPPTLPHLQRCRPGAQAKERSYVY